MAEALLILTDAAREKVIEIQESQKRENSAVRVAVMKDGLASFRYDLRMVSQDEKADDDEVVDSGGVLVYIDKESVPRIKGATLDFVSGLEGSGFKFDNPNTPELPSDPIAARVQKLFDEKINPGIASHGGVISLIEVKDGTVYIQMGGGCQGCGMADVTLKSGIEAMLLEEIPEITAVLDTTDHASGSNPYYQPGK